MITAITDVFTEIGTWITSQISALMPVFYTEADGLTFLGILAVCGLAFSVIFLIMGIIKRFLHFRG